MQFPLLQFLGYQTLALHSLSLLRQSPKRGQLSQLQLILHRGPQQLQLHQDRLLSITLLLQAPRRFQLSQLQLLLLQLHLHQDRLLSIVEVML